MGPSKRNELGDGALAAYNGVGGGRFWKWYESGVFEAELKKLRATFERFSERECVDDLRNTSARILVMSREYKADLTPYGGPQCYPQVKRWKKDNKKVLANRQIEQAKKHDVGVGMMWVSWWKEKRAPQAVCQRTFERACLTS